MKLVISLSAAAKIAVGDRVVGEFDKNDWSLGKVEKITPTGYKINFDYGELRLVKTGAMRIVKVSKGVKKSKKALTLAQVRELRDAYKAEQVEAKKPVPVKSKKPVAKGDKKTTKGVPAKKEAPEKPAKKKTTVVVNKKPDAPRAAKPIKPVAPPKDNTPPVGGTTQTKEEAKIVQLCGKESLWEKAQKSEMFRDHYLHYVWNTANKTFFDGKMQKPNFRWKRNVSADKFRGLGHWIGGSKREMAISPRLFNASTQEIAVTTIVHEMCHQAVSEIDKTSENHINRGHGPKWNGWMLKCGLTPARYAKNDRTEYMTDEEAERHTKKMENYKKGQQEAKQKYERLWMPQQGDYVIYHVPSSDTWEKGVLACPNDKAGKRWAVVTKPRSTDWRIIPTEWLYKLPEAERQSIGDANTLRSRVQDVVNYYKQKDEVRAIRSLRRKAWGY